MTTTTGAIRRLELLLARTPDMECADDLRFLLADYTLVIANYKTVCLNNEDLTQKLAEARRLLDDARAQKPVAWRPKFDIEGDWSLGEPPIESIEYWHGQGLEIEYAYLRSAPVPAQPAADVAAIAKAVRDIPSRLESLGGQRFAYVKLSEVIETIYSVAGKQPAEVPEAVAKDAIREFLAADGATKQYEGKWAQPRQWKYNDPEMIRLRAARSALEALLSTADTEVKK